MSEPILVTGATGNTGAPLVRLLTARGANVRAAHRHAGIGEVRFDWGDPSTFGPALAGVGAAYVLLPYVAPDRLGLLRPFLDAAVEAGTRRLAFLGSSMDGVPGMAEVYQAVRDAVPEWSLLRPSWFMQNFLGWHPIGAAIRDTGEVATATGAGRLGFVDAADIAAVAAADLLADGPLRQERLITGPEALSYADVAAIITEETGHPVRYTELTEAQAIQRWVDRGLPEAAAALGARVDLAIRDGAEDRVSPVVAQVTGRTPRSLREFVLASQNYWTEGKVPAE